MSLKSKGGGVKEWQRRPASESLPELRRDAAATFAPSVLKATSPTSKHTPKVKNFTWTSLPTGECLDRPPAKSFRKVAT